MLFEKVLWLNPTGRNEGIDLTEEMLSRARARVQRSGVSSYVLKIGDAYDLKYPNNSFDLLLNNYMFDLIPEKDFEVILAEFKRVLRKGGRIVMVNMTKGSRTFNAVWEWLYETRSSLLGGCRGIELSSYLKSAGFEGIRREYLTQMSFPSEIIYGVTP